MSGIVNPRARAGCVLRLCSGGANHHETTRCQD
jgi:hypothetical protein